MQESIHLSSSAQWNSGLLHQPAVLGQLSSQFGNLRRRPLLQLHELIALQNPRDGLLAGLPTMRFSATRTWARIPSTVWSPRTERSLAASSTLPAIAFSIDHTVNSSLEFEIPVK
jgi:hypothetical protein